ncbi:MAG: fimbrillin family protein [Bacteroides sp.]|nr:fimbrillin family protein [Bacteroides sp.]
MNPIQYVLSFLFFRWKMDTLPGYTSDNGSDGLQNEGVASCVWIRLLLSKWYTLLVGMLLITGCAQHEDLIPGEEERMPVHFASALPASSATRTTNGGDHWVSGNDIGIFVKEADSSLAPETIIETYQNRRYRVRTSGNSNFATLYPYYPIDTIYFPNQKHIDFIAYYPYYVYLEVSETSPYYLMPLDSTRMMDQSGEYSRSVVDMLYSDNETNRYRAQKDSVRLSFIHVMSKLRINVIAGQGMQDTDFSRVNAKIWNVPYMTKLSIADGSLTNILTNASNKISMWRWDAPEVSYDATCEAILIPGTTPDRKVEFITEDAQSFTWSLDDSIVFEQGKIHIWDITIVNKSASGRSKQAHGSVASAADIQVVNYTITDREVGSAAEHPDLRR